MAGSWKPDDIPDLTGRLAVVTGGNAGLGLAIAHRLVEHHARVIVACRNADKAAAAVSELRTAHDGAEVSFALLDLARLTSVRALGEQLRRDEPRLDLLVNNAGLMAIDHALTEEGFEMQIGVNHLGHFVLTLELMPLLLVAPEARVVTMTSFGHRAGHLAVDDLMFERRRYDRWQPYFQSKLANILFTRELERRLRVGHTSVQALAAHPGATHTDLGSEGSGLTNAVMRPAMVLGQSTDEGAQPMLRAATDPAARGGELYGPRFLLRGPAVRETPSARARRDHDARALWKRSEHLTGATLEL